MRGLKLFVSRDVLPEPDEDEFYQADLLGLRAETPDGRPLGKVKAVQNFRAGDLLEVDPGQGRPSVLYPFTRDVVPEVRLAEGRLIIVPPVEAETGEPEGGGDEE
jgi:16S rRNA processing protein RimM